MAGNGSREGANNAVFFEREKTFRALDSLDPPVRIALYEAPVPFSPVQVRDYGRSSGLRGERLAAVVRSMSAKEEARAQERIERAMGVRRQGATR